MKVVVSRAVSSVTAGSAFRTDKKITVKQPRHWARLSVTPMVMNVAP
jgi:hypothetical protein